MVRVLDGFLDGQSPWWLESLVVRVFHGWSFRWLKSLMVGIFDGQSLRWLDFLMVGGEKIIEDYPKLL